MQNPHRGEYLLLNFHAYQTTATGYNDDDVNELRNFQLTDDEWDVSFTDEPKQGEVMVQAYQDFYTSDRDVFEAEAGEILSGGSNSKLLDILAIDECSEGSFNDVCRAVNQEFDTENTFSYGDIEDNWGIESQSPVHSNGRYLPDGEIILGYEPEHYVFSTTQDRLVGTGGHGPYFYVCREGATMENAQGEQVPQVVDIDRQGPELYQCDPDTALYGDGSGERVYECNSGLSHDEDSLVDHRWSWYHSEFDDKNHDPDCLEREADKDVACPERAVRVEDGESAEIVAQYVDDGECTVPRDEDGNIDVNDIEEDIDDGDILTETEPEVTECMNDEENLLVDQPSYCSGLDYDGFGDDFMPVVEYGPTEEYFEQLDAIRERDLDSDGVETRFVNHWGWDTPQWQSLYQAERKYDLYGGDSCIWCHNPDFWRDRIGLQNWDAYEEDNPYEHEPPRSHIEAWTIQNAGADNELVSSTENPSSEEEIFQGGFAGKCEGALRWGYDEDPEDPTENRWQCTGAPDWEQPVILPEIETPHTESTNIGMAVMHTNLKQPDWIAEGTPEEFRNFPRATEDVDLELDTLNVKCWAGAGEEPDEEDTHLYFEKEDIDVPSDPDTPFGVYGEVDMTGHSRYSCSWHYTTEQEEMEIINSGTPVLLHEDDDQFIEVKDSHFENMEDSGDHGLQENYSSSEFAQQMDSWGIAAAN